MISLSSIRPVDIDAVICASSLTTLAAPGVARWVTAHPPSARQ